jgi:hypothetical protein
MSIAVHDWRVNDIVPPPETVDFSACAVWCLGSLCGFCDQINSVKKKAKSLVDGCRGGRMVEKSKSRGVFQPLIFLNCFQNPAYEWVVDGNESCTVSQIVGRRQTCTTRTYSMSGLLRYLASASVNEAFWDSRRLTHLDLFIWSSAPSSLDTVPTQTHHRNILYCGKQPSSIILRRHGQDQGKRRKKCFFRRTGKGKVAALLVFNKASENQW